MNEAPKKIWVNDMGGWFETENSHDTPYIRADLFDELVGALETCLMYGAMTGDDWVSLKAETVLAKIKEET